MAAPPSPHGEHAAGIPGGVPETGAGSTAAPVAGSAVLVDTAAPAGIVPVAAAVRTVRRLSCSPSSLCGGLVT